MRRITLQGHRDGVTAVAVTPDGSEVISASFDETLKVWDRKSGEELRTLRGHRDRVTAVAVTPNGSEVISASEDRTLKVWDRKSGNVTASFTADGALRACAVAADGMTVIAGDASGAMHFLKLIVP